MATPILILQGDKSKAKQWIPYAEIQLARFKLINSIVNQAFKPVPCILVHVRSVNNIDRIRVKACFGGRCNLPTPDAPGIISSEFVMECPESGEPKTRISFSAEDYWPWTDRRLYGGTWWFGDPSTSSRPTGTTTARTYGKGTFYPSLTTYTGFLPPASPAVFSGKSAVGETSADAHANWLAAPWITPFGGFTGAAWSIRETGSFPNRFTYTGVKFTQEYDLTGVYTLDPQYIAKIWYRLTEHDILVPSGGVVSASPGGTVAAGAGTQEISDVTSSIGGNVSVDFTDANGFPILPEPAFGKTIGYVSSAVSVPQNFRRTTKTLVIKGSGTIKQAGASEHEQPLVFNDEI